LEQIRIDTVESFNNFAAKFQTRTLPKSSWTHEAHFVIALWFILRYGLDKAQGLVREGIKKYNEATGVANTEHEGYHETVTMFYLKLVQDFTDQHLGLNEIELLDKLLKSEVVSKGYLLRFYSHARLMSKEARLGWIEPDIKQHSLS
jgi:hypothetical protein